MKPRIVLPLRPHKSAWIGPIGWTAGILMFAGGILANWHFKNPDTWYYMIVGSLFWTTILFLGGVMVLLIGAAPVIVGIQLYRKWR
jgi:hypothetical protein